MADEFDLDAALAEIEDMTPAAEPERKPEPAPKAEAATPRAAMERAARPVTAETVRPASPDAYEPEPVDTDIGDAPQRAAPEDPSWTMSKLRQLSEDRREGARKIRAAQDAELRNLPAIEDMPGAIAERVADFVRTNKARQEEGEARARADDWTRESIRLATDPTGHMTRIEADRFRRTQTPEAAAMRAYGRRAGDLGAALVEQMKADPRLTGPTRADVDAAPPAAMVRAATLPTPIETTPSPGFNVTETFEVGEAPKREPSPAQAARRALVAAGMPVDEAKALLDNEAIEAAKEL